MIQNFKNKFKEMLHLNDSPKRIALAFAVGVFIAFSPILGFHTLMVLLSAWLFRLNPLALLIGAFVNNPWTFAPLYGICLWFGILLYGGSSAFPQIIWHNITFLGFLENLKPFVGPFFLGTTIIGIFFALLSYFLIYFFICQVRKSGINMKI